MQLDYEPILKWIILKTLKLVLYNTLCRLECLFFCTFYKSIYYKTAVFFISLTASKKSFTDIYFIDFLQNGTQWDSKTFQATFLKILILFKTIFYFESKAIKKQKAKILPKIEIQYVKLCM